MGIKLDKLRVKRHIKESLLHGRSRQAESLLHEVHAQHGLQRKGRATVLAFGVVRGDELDQSCPRYDVIHLGQELALAGLLGV